MKRRDFISGVGSAACAVNNVPVVFNAGTDPVISQRSKR